MAFASASVAMLPWSSLSLCGAPAVKSRPVAVHSVHHGPTRCAPRAAPALLGLSSALRALRGRSLGTGRGCWLRSGDVVEVNWDEVWWPCNVLQVSVSEDRCTVKYHDGGDVEESVDVAERVRKPKARSVEPGRVMEVWCEGAWRHGTVRDVEVLQHRCVVDFMEGDTREDVPLCELRDRADGADTVGRFMEAQAEGTEWRECEVLEDEGGRYQVRFLDGEEREVTKVREPPVPLYMLYVGQGCQGRVSRIDSSGAVSCDIGAEATATMPKHLLGARAAKREDIDLGDTLDLWICGVDPGRRRVLVSPWPGAAAAEEVASARQRRFRDYILRA